MTATVTVSQPLATEENGAVMTNVSGPGPAKGELKRSLANVGWAPECPQCASMLQFQEGCMTCRGCGYSKCT